MALVQSFEGDLFDKLESISIDELEKPTAFDAIFRVLEQYFRYSVEVQQPEKIESFTMEFRRLKGESLIHNTFCGTKRKFKS